MSSPSAGPTAASITVAETLSLLEGPFVAIRRGVVNGRYALWLGSGISRGRLPDLGQLVLKVLDFLHAHSVADGADSPHRKALEQAIELARLRQDEVAQIELDKPPATWPVLQLVIEGLLNRYSELLDIRVDGQAPDHLLWDAVDVSEVYGGGIEPDCEHLCIGILVLEGVVGEVATANWDGLIEAALAELGGDLDVLVRVVVIPEELRQSDRALTLLKFHGCAVLAAQDPDKYRGTLVATRPQITAWNTQVEIKPIRDKMVALATTKPTLMIGLSAQDENIQRVFAQAEAEMKWVWPADPPAHVFADDELGGDHGNILRVVYRSDYAEHAADIEVGALIRAYAKPLLTALVLAVITDKLCSYLAEVDAPLLRADREQLNDGLQVICQRIAAAAEPDRLRFVQEIITRQHRALALFQDGCEPPGGAPAYTPLGNVPADRVRTDPGLRTNGVRELAAAVALLGRGETAGHWSLATGSAPSGAESVIKVIAGASEAAVFFAANAGAAMRLQLEGVVGVDASDVVVINSTGRAEAAARSPRGRYGRTGRVGVREVDMCELLKSSSDLVSLEDAFRQTVSL
jgi:hypothetical protein